MTRALAVDKQCEHMHTSGGTPRRSLVHTITPQKKSALFRVARGLMGTADGVSDAVDRSERFGPGGPGSVSIRGGVCRGVVWGSPGDAQRSAVGGNNVSFTRYGTK